MLNVDSIRKGIVLDHIQAGRSMEIYKYLGLDEIDCSVAIIKNAKSKKMGKKDIIKIEGYPDIDFDLLGFIDDSITVNIIDEDKIIEKKKLSMPKNITGIIKCKNPRCITSVEQGLVHMFRLADREKNIYRCVYCEQEYLK